MQHVPSIGSLEVGKIPRVVGTVTEEATLRRLAGGEAVPCDIVEVRLDQVGVSMPGGLDLCWAIGESAAPVLLTLRHAEEGGAWRGTEAERIRLLKEALPLVQAVDTEIRQGGLAETVRIAEGEGRLAIGSYHDFERTPDDEILDAVIREGLAQGAHVTKIATFIRGPEDERRMAALLDRYPDRPLSLLGMGPLGTETRVRLPCLGSCLTYGYLDRPAAPGQISAGDLRDRLAAACPAYAAALGG